MVLSDFLSDWYLWIKAFHVMAVISWMAGIFYLPRLFVYHATAGNEGDVAETLKVMEFKLYRYIMVNSMYATWAAGLAMVWVIGFSDVWLWVKFTAVVAMTGYHYLLRYHMIAFREGRNTRDHRYFRVLNEVPTILMVIIVIMVIVKPF
jgi:putative membrane protein